MKKFSKKDIIRFLKTLDSLLIYPFEIEIIGGAAAAIAFSSSAGTVDIDTTEGLNALEGVLDGARTLSGIDIPMGCGGVWDGPHYYRRRRKRAKIKGLKRLKVYTPDLYDWALMKVMRFRERDQNHIAEAHRKVGFNKNILIRRFLSEMSYVCSNLVEVVYNFIQMVNMLFGVAEAKRVLKVIRRHKKWKDSIPVEFDPFIGPQEP